MKNNNSYINIVLPNLIHWEDIYGLYNWVLANKNSLCLEFFNDLHCCISHSREDYAVDFGMKF